MQVSQPPPSLCFCVNSYNQITFEFEINCHQILSRAHVLIWARGPDLSLSESIISTKATTHHIKADRDFHNLLFLLLDQNFPRCWMVSFLLQSPQFCSQAFQPNKGVIQIQFEQESSYRARSLSAFYNVPSILLNILMCHANKVLSISNMMH